MSKPFDILFNGKRIADITIVMIESHEDHVAEVDYNIVELLGDLKEKRTALDAIEVLASREGMIVINQLKRSDSLLRRIFARVLPVLQPPLDYEIIMSTILSPQQYTRVKVYYQIELDQPVGNPEKQSEGIKRDG